MYILEVPFLAFIRKAEDVVSILSMAVHTTDDALRVELHGLVQADCANCFMNKTASLPDSTAYTALGLAAAMRAR